jgi:hypothetical protein
MTNVIYKALLIQQIMGLLTKMKNGYPALYRYLDESSLSVYLKNDHDIYPSDMEAYIVSLEEQMKSTTGTMS